ncbi:AraC family transcriptional regulator [Paenibacillus tarimensis]
MKNNWFFRLLLSYLPIFLIFMLTLSIIFYLAAAEISKKQVLRANLLFTEQVVQSIDYSLRTIEHLVNNELSSRENWDRFFDPNEGENKYVIEYEISRKLTQLKQSSLLIDSIYLIRTKDRHILGDHSSLSSIENFEDKEFVMVLLKEDHSGNHYLWTEQRPVTRFNQVPSQVVSLIRKYPLLSGELGFMVVNVKVNAIRNYLVELSGSKLSYVQLYDRNGNYMTGNEASNTEKEVLGNPLSSVKSNYTGWEARSGIYGSGIGSHITLVSYIWFILIFIVFIAGTALIILATKRNYKPIKMIMNKIYNYSSAAGQLKFSETDELKIIETAFDDLVKKSSADLLYKRKHFFLELIQGNAPAGLEWQNEMKSLGLNLHFHYAVAGIIEIDRYTIHFEKYSQRDQRLLRFAIANVMGEIARNYDMDVWVEWITKERLGMLLHYSKSNGEIDIILRQMGERLVDWVTFNLKFTITVSYGIPVHKPEEVHMTFHKASEAMNYKAVLGNSRVITQKEVTSRNAGMIYEQLTVIRSMAQCYRLGDERWKEQLEQVFSEIQDGMISREDIVKLAGYMVYLLYKEMMELSDEIKELWSSEAMPKLTKEIEQIDVLNEFHQRVMALLGSYYEQIDKLRKDRNNHPLIQEVRKFVEDNYTDPNMSLSLIAEKFELKTSYLSRMFKVENGENFVDYLARIRMEKAMELLKNTTAPIQEISMIVGYAHYISFNRVFKKLTGMTPGDYRRSASLQKE